MVVKVLSFLSNENCFAGHSRGPCGPHVARGPGFEHHCSNRMRTNLSFDCITYCLFQRCVFL